MKHLSSFRFLLLIGMMSLFLASCGDDSNTLNPQVILKPGTGLVTADAIVNFGETFKVNITGQKTENAMKTLTINEVDTRVALDRLTFTGIQGRANPLLLLGDLTSAFDFTVEIKATTIGIKNYNFIVEDVNGNKSTATVSITTNGTPPSIDMMSAPSLTVAPSALAGFTFKVTKGTALLKTVEVLINGVTATDLSRLFYDDQITTPFASNPLPIPTADANGFERKIFVRSPAATGNYKYTFKFTDESGQSVSQEVTLIATDLTLLEGVLFNQSGPTGTGGLDLDNGKGTGSTDTKAEIRDEGNNINLPAASNWRQQVSGVNGSEVRYITKGVSGAPADFSFDNVSGKAQIQALWANGEAFTQKSGNRDISNKIAKDDVMIVKNGTKYFIITFKEINITTSLNDNGDNYRLDIKF